LETDLERFLTDEGLDATQHSSERPKSSKGLSENQNWSAILVEVLIELLKADRESPLDTDKIIDTAMKRVIPREGSKLPKADTVADKIDQVIKQFWPKQ
jgi:hypothetical protein